MCVGSYLSADRSLSTPLVTFFILQSAQCAKPSCNRSSDMLPF